MNDTVASYGRAFDAVLATNIGIVRASGDQPVNLLPMWVSAHGARSSTSHAIDLAQVVQKCREFRTPGARYRTNVRKACENSEFFAPVSLWVSKEGAAPRGGPARYPHGWHGCACACFARSDGDH
jgi:hypothetical protein